MNPSVTRELMSRIERQTRERLYESSQALGLRCPEIDIDFTLRGRGAGQVRIDAAKGIRVRYNLEILQLHPRQFAERTVPHEIAHILCFIRYGRGVRPHGDEWRAMMCMLGADPSRCHSYDLSALKPARQMSRYSYSCACREHQLTAIRHNRVRRGQRYHCTHCRTELKPGSSST